MASKATHNFHLPLPPALHDQLRREAERSAKSATTLAREALEEWLAQKRKRRLHDEITAYAAEHAGTEMDLDEELEAAAIDCLLREVEG